MNLNQDVNVLSGYGTSVHDLQKQDRFFAAFKIGSRHAFNVQASGGGGVQLLHGGVSRTAIGYVSAPSSSRSYSSENQGPYLHAVRETRLRAVFGVTLLLIGIRLVYYCDRTFNRHLGWRGWLCWLAASTCFVLSFVLLLFRDSLFRLSDLF